MEPKNTNIKSLNSLQSIKKKEEDEIKKSLSISLQNLEKKIEEKKLIEQQQNDTKSLIKKAIEDRYNFMQKSTFSSEQIKIMNQYEAGLNDQLKQLENNFKLAEEEIRKAESAVEIIRNQLRKIVNELKSVEMLKEKRIKEIECEKEKKNEIEFEDIVNARKA